MQNAERQYNQRFGLTRIAFTVFSLAATANFAVAEGTSLNTHLACFQPLLGKTMKGEFTTSTAEKPVVDVQHWERALNGQAVRVLHSINKGIYGGETLFVWDDDKKTVAYYYFTTAGFMTTGTVSTNAEHIVASEKVAGEAGGVTEVRSTSEIRPDGKFHVKAEYLKDGNWVFGHEATYAEDSASQVVFK